VSGERAKRGRRDFEGTGEGRTARDSREPTKIKEGVGLTTEKCIFGARRARLTASEQKGRRYELVWNWKVAKWGSCSVGLSFSGGRRTVKR
jgi:hypothetical protein